MPPTLTAVLAAQLPPDCPPEILLAPQRDYATRMLQIAFTQADDEVQRREELALPRGPETARRFDIERALDEVSKVGFASLLNYLALHLPPGFNANVGLFQITKETRIAWAKEQAKALLQSRPEWALIAPDIQDEIAKDVAEAWYAGLKERLFRSLCMVDYDALVSRMTQAQLYKWLLDDKEPWVINRYSQPRFLTLPYFKKLVTQFSPAQWDEIESKISVLPEVVSPEDAISEARLYRRLAEQV